MRQARTVQGSIFDLFASHEIGCELKAMSDWPDEHRDLVGLVARDLCRHSVKAIRPTAIACCQCWNATETGGNLPTVPLLLHMVRKLADALWSMESNGVVLNQKADDIWLGNEPEPKVSEEFLKLSSMTPAERIRYFFLSGLHRSLSLWN